MRELHFLWCGVYSTNGVILIAMSGLPLFDQFLERFGEREIACLTADREFIGKDWFGYLLSDPLTPFRIRIRENHKLRHGCQSLKVNVLFQDLQVGQHKVLRHKRQLWGHWVYIAALRLEDGSLLVVATQTAPKSAISDYAQRWAIETLFGIFTPRGFCLETTHLTDSERLTKLLALLSLALCWVILTGDKSIFRYGFDHLRNIVLNLEQKIDDFLNILQFLSCI